MEIEYILRFRCRRSQRGFQHRWLVKRAAGTDSMAGRHCVELIENHAVLAAPTAYWPVRSEVLKYKGGINRMMKCDMCYDCASLLYGRRASNQNQPYST